MSVNLCLQRLLTLILWFLLHRVLHRVGGEWVPTLATIFMFLVPLTDT
jgi:hypothetical protein